MLSDTEKTLLENTINETGEQAKKHKKVDLWHEIRGKISGKIQYQKRYHK